MDRNVEFPSVPVVPEWIDRNVEFLIVLSRRIEMSSVLKSQSGWIDVSRS